MKCWRDRFRRHRRHVAYGRWRRVPGTIVGVILIAPIQNGLVPLNMSAFSQQVPIGALIVGAVLLDYIAKRRRL